MSRPERPADDGATVWLDFDTPATGSEASAEAVNAIVEQGATLVGRYKLLQKIGEGHLSQVYKAIDLRVVEQGSSADPCVAVRVLKEPLARGNDAIEQLSSQIQALQSVTHPNIVRVIDCGREADTAFITMELLSGNSLQEKINTMKSGGMTRKEALPVIHAMVSALEFAHGKNIVHGDLKPEDVIIADTGAIKVMDFGFARRAAIENAKNLTSAYASAEVLEGARPDPRDDVFALACITWRLLTGADAFHGDGAAAARDARQQLTCPSQLTAREFNALRRALEFERSKRTLSVHQFEAEFLGSGGGGVSKSLRTLGIAAVILLALVAAGLFARKALTTHQLAALAPQSDSAPSELAPGTAFRDCQGCPLMKVMAPGSFLQGSAADDPEAQPFEKPQHSVSIAYPFAAGVFEVTVGQFAQYVTETGADVHGCTVYDGDWHASADISWKNAIDGQTASHPVSCVSWQDAKRYAAWLSQRTHQLYRLPSASEWEYAARAGSTSARPWTDDSLGCTYGNLADQTAAARFPGWVVLPCADKYVLSAPVGSFEANAFGLYDMLGNVFEWVDDCWADDYNGAPSDGSARTDADCSQRELRGGSWFTEPDFVRVSYRDRFPSNYRSTSVGFRLIREITR
jgi:formylglycine-generating enzyme required for sulfatase activity